MVQADVDNAATDGSVTRPDEQAEAPRITATEALFGFIGWLTALETPVTLSRNHDAGIACDLVAEFMQSNNLPDCRDGIYPKNIRQPRTRRTHGCPPNLRIVDRTNDSPDSTSA